MNLIETLIHIFSTFLEGIIDIVRFQIIYLEVLAVVLMVALILAVMLMHAVGYDRRILNMGRQAVGQSRQKDFADDAEDAPFLSLKI